MFAEQYYKKTIRITNTCDFVQVDQPFSVCISVFFYIMGK